HKGVLWGMYVKPDGRGTGLGKLLAERVIEHAETAVEELLLKVVSANPAAVKLYKSLGFAEYGVERRAMKIGADYYDEVLMALPLRKSS
ncbi:MAG: GNAT family N-acetyltransferase, partial [Alphaproteobacteria bacterium]|nr:GNAT family N-acetyltransferase [Alphaproteobacteria bacterium]